MNNLLQYIIEYVIVSFVLGVVWHLALFSQYYKRLAIYSRLENPLFIFGLSSMLIQGVVFAYVYPLVGNAIVFGVGLFLTLVSFMVFAEAGKQNTTSLSGFVLIQLLFSFVQALLVTLVFSIIPIW